MGIISLVNEKSKLEKKRAFYAKAYERVNLEPTKRKTARRNK